MTGEFCEGCGREVHYGEEVERDESAGTVQHYDCPEWRDWEPTAEELAVIEDFHDMLRVQDMDDELGAIMETIIDEARHER
jgi:hypothetical protein